MSNSKILQAIISMCFIVSLAIGQPIEFERPLPLALTPYPGPGKLAAPPPALITFLDNVQINHDTTTELQNEEVVCINPTNPDNAVAIWRDFRLGFRRVGVGYTFDGGHTRTDALLQVPPHPRQSDPVLWVDRNGVFYASTLTLVWGDGPSGISVQKSTDGGVTWSEPTYVVDGQVDYFEDKQWFAMDQTSGPGDGNIYCVWDRFAADYSSTQIVSSTSTDGGQTFSPPVGVSVDGPNYVQWPVVTVDTSSYVYVAWYDHRNPRRISFARSTDFGATYEPERAIIYLESSYRQINGEIAVFPFPAISCDIYPQSDYRGTLYIVYADGSGDWDIWCRRSSDGGQTWTERVRVNDDPPNNGQDQFHPWLSIDNDGVIHVCFFDRRDDPNNLLYNLYYTRSTDGGETWEINHRISTVSSDPSNAALAGLLGEYIGISAWNSEVQMVWTDVRNWNQDVFSARIEADFVSGDVNGNDLLTGADVTYLVSYFKGTNPVPDPPIWRADANGDCLIGASDVTYLVAYFKGLGAAPVDGGCG